MPSYATVTPSGESTYTWTATTSTPAPCRCPARANRIAAAWYSATSFTVDVNLTDGQAHDLELYFLDWDNGGRAEQVQISDATTGTVLDTETISSFTSGVYLDWQVSGNLVITITGLAGVNAVLNGLFLDPTVSGSVSIGSLASDRPGGGPVLQTITGGVPAVITDFLGAVGDGGLAAGPGLLSHEAAGPAPRAAAVDPSGKPASGVAIPVTAKGPRPNGNLLQAAARRFARRPSNLVRQPGLDSRGQSIRQFGQ